MWPILMCFIRNVLDFCHSSWPLKVKGKLFFARGGDALWNTIHSNKSNLIFNVWDQKSDIASVMWLLHNLHNVSFDIKYSLVKYLNIYIIFIHVVVFSLSKEPTEYTGMLLKIAAQNSFWKICEIVNLFVGLSSGLLKLENVLHWTCIICFRNIQSKTCSYLF